MNSLGPFPKTNYKGANEDMIQYVKDTHDVEGDMVDNRGPKRLNDMGELLYERRGL